MIETSLISLIYSDENQLVVGRKLAVYCYEYDSKGACFALEADKKIVAWVKYAPYPVEPKFINEEF